MSSSSASDAKTLLAGDEGRACASSLLATSPLCALATYPEYDATSVKQGRPHEPEPLQLLAISNGERHCVLDVGRTPGLHTIWPKDRAVAALDGQRLQHALWRADGGEPARWASFGVMAQLLAAPLPIESDANALARDVGRTSSLPDASTLLGLAARADAFVTLAWAQAEALRGAELHRVARLEAAAVTPIASLERHGLPFDANALRGLVEQERHWLQTPAATEDVARAKRTSHLLMTAGDNLLACVTPKSKIHAQFQQIAASSGRMASRHPNVQALPKQNQRRACVKAPTGHVLVMADYAACELRILAHASGDQAYRDAFASDEDVHKTIAARLFQKASPAEVTDAERAAAKAVSFGLVYGMHAKGLSLRLGCSHAEAQSHINSFFRMYPAIQSYLHDNAARDIRRGEVRTLTGRRIRLLAEEAQRNERLARNLPIQGSGADILKIAMRLLHSSLRQRPHCQLIHAVHDSLIVLAPHAQQEETRSVLCHAMHDAARAVADQVAWKVDLSVSPRWA